MRGLLLLISISCLMSFTQESIGQSAECLASARLGCRNQITSMVGDQARWNHCLEQAMLRCTGKSSPTENDQSTTASRNDERRNSRGMRINTGINDEETVQTPTEPENDPSKKEEVANTKEETSKEDQTQEVPDTTPTNAEINCPEGLEGEACDNYKVKVNSCMGNDELDPMNEVSCGNQAQRDLTDEVMASNQCEQVASEAKNCCNNPIKCFNPSSKSSFGSFGNMGVINSILPMAGQMVSGGDIQKLCQGQMTLSQIGMAVNGAMAATCVQQRMKCTKTCDQGIASLYCGPGDALCESRKRKMQRTRVSCEGLDGQAAQLTMAAVQANSDRLMSKLCVEESASSKSTLTGLATDPTGVDCADPANASNPFCKNCARPGAEKDPVCQQIIASAPKGTGLSSFDKDQFGASANKINVNDDGTTQSQMPIGFGNKMEAASSAGIGAGGGGGLPGGGGDGNFGGNEDQGGGGNSKSSINTDTLHGVGGGGGYSVSSMGFQSPGGGSYNYNRGSEGSSASAFNLKKYLPSQQLQGRTQLRGPAGLAAGHRDISSASGDIFQKISNRFRDICAKGRLIGCGGPRPASVNSYGR